MRFRVSWIGLLPPFVQKSIFSWTGLEHRILPFHVKHGSTWLAYEITRPEKVQAKLPPDLVLADISVFQETPKPVLFYNFFKFESQFFQGHRLEFVTVALHKKTGKSHFVILDYLSDAISSDPTHIFRDPTRSRMSLQCQSEYHYCEIPDEFFVFCAHGSEQEQDSNHFHSFPSSINRQFSVECNEEIYYGSSFAQTPNKLWFSEQDTSHVVPFSPVVIKNPYHTSIRASTPFLAFYYPKDIVFSILMGKQPHSHLDILS